MAGDSAIAMTSEERDEFLGSGATGVISLAEGDEPPHSLPVSYGYDGAEETFYFRLATGGSSAKGDLDGRAVSFVVYGDATEGWRSVVARGRLEDVERDGIETETLAGLDRVDIPLVSIFNQPIRAVEFEFYRLVPEELTGRVERDAT